MNTNERIRCNVCKVMTRLPEGVTVHSTYTKFAVEGGAYAKHSCGKLYEVVTISGKTGVQECGDKCISATGPACECKCSGENHGGMAA